MQCGSQCIQSREIHSQAVGRAVCEKMLIKSLTQRERQRLNWELSLKGVVSPLTVDWLAKLRLL